MVAPNMDLARRIYEMRIREDMTQEELGLRVGYSQASISRFERGDIPREAAEQLAPWLGISVKKFRELVDAAEDGSKSSDPEPGRRRGGGKRSVSTGTRRGPRQH